MADDSGLVLSTSSCLLLLTVFGYASGGVVPGSLDLNSGVFDKVIQKFHAVFVKFDEAFTYGDKQIEFKKVALAAIAQPELMVAEVHIAEYGDRDNMDLADRFRVDRDRLPVYKLFLQGGKDIIRYTGNEYDAEDIKKFITETSGLWLGPPGCLKEFDNLITEFFDVEVKQRREIVAKTEAAAQELTKPEDKQSAKIYIRVMQKVVENGIDAVKMERQRVRRLQEERVSEKKKEELKRSLNILTAFATRMKEGRWKKKDEL